MVCVMVVCCVAKRKRVERSVLFMQTKKISASRISETIQLPNLYIFFSTCIPHSIPIFFETRCHAYRTEH